jgi:hypothetical protein
METLEIGVRSPVLEDFSLLYMGHTSFRVRPASYPIGAWVSFLKDDKASLDLKLTIPINTEVKNT